MKEKQAIMTPEEEKFMALEGLIQWIVGAINQGKTLEAARLKMIHNELTDHQSRRLFFAQLRCDQHYFSIAAHQVLEHLDWVKRSGLCRNIDFSILKEFSSGDIKDLRDMREHVIEYFKGKGKNKSRWVINHPEFRGDASGVVGNLIGGRLDWVRFAAAAAKLLPELLAEPMAPPLPRL